jgi:four helix bundle protein
MVQERTNLNGGSDSPRQDRLESFGIYQLACHLFDDFWNDSDALGKDFRGRELAKQQVRSLDSVCANMEEGYGRGYGKELPQHLKISRGEARESRGRYLRCQHLLPGDLIHQRVAMLDHIIGGLTNTIEAKKRRPAAATATRHPSPVTRHEQ